MKWEARFNEAEGGRVNLAEPCRAFGISRQTGYEWVGRYRETARIDSLVDRSRRPLRMLLDDTAGVAAALARLRAWPVEGLSLEAGVYEVIDRCRREQWDEALRPRVAHAGDDPV